MKVGAKLALWVAVVGTAMASPVWAGSLSADLTAGAGASLYTNNLNVRFLKSDTPAPSWNVVFNIAIGKLNWTNVQVPGALGVPFAPGDSVGGYFQNLQNTNTGFSAFCIEGTQPLTAPTSGNWLTTDLQNAPNPGSVGLVGGMGATRAAWMTEFWSDNIASVHDAETAAAFQLGLWAILYNATDLNYFKASNLDKFDMIAANKFQIAGAFGTHLTTDALSDPAVVDAALMLTNVDGVYSVDPSFVLLALTDPSVQDQIVGFDLPGVGGPAIPVPLPAALPAGLSLMGAIVAYGKIRRR